MTYALAAGLQQAVFQHLSADAALADLLGGAIFDAMPAGPVPPLYLSLGPEVARDRSDGTAAGAVHDISLSVVAEAGGFHALKTVAAAVCDALAGADLVLARGRLVSLLFIRAQARREGAGQVRRIDLSFRARLDDI